MNTNRVNKYLSLVEKGALEAQRRILLINSRKSELVRNLEFGTPVKEYTGHVPWFIPKFFRRSEDKLQNMKNAVKVLKEIIHDEELVLIKRVDRGIRNFRKTIKFKAFVKTSMELGFDARYFESIFKKVYKLQKLVETYKQRIEVQDIILRRINDTNFEELKKEFLDAFSKQEFTYGFIRLRLEEIRKEYPAFITNFENELRRLSKIKRTEKVVEKIGTLTQDIFTMGFFLVAAEIIVTQFDANARESFSFLGAIIGLFVGISGLAGGTIIEQESRKVAEFFLKLKS